jgi:hypothetical protein
VTNVENIELAKMKGAELRQFAGEESGELVDVVIELDLPQWQLIVKRVDRGGVSVRIPASVEFETSSEEEEVERRVAEARAFLEDVLGEPPLWNSSAGSFVASVTPKQLRTVASNPTIKAIWPSRMRWSPYGMVGLGNT